MNLLPCPVCKTAKHVHPHGREEFFCDKCKGLFSDPNEGGDYSDRNPAARLEREERRQHGKGSRR